MQETLPLDVIIELTDCTIWQQDHLVLTGVNLSVGKGEFIYLVGKVGSGKSSLIKTLNAQIPLKSGTALVAGYNLAKIKKKEIPYLRRKIGIVFQDFQLLTDRSVNENLEFVLKATGWKNNLEIETRIGEVLDKVGLGRKGYKMPHQLSGGEQQRVVIGRALLNDPDIILADEPTGNLDPETSEGIIRLLTDISKTGRAVVVATHNYTLLKKFSARTLKCEEGKLLQVNEDEEIELI
ncbi:MAG: phosphonate ABC transporter ATP-binding protein [Bacteroidetes bacterium GWE2_41_25]|nr:MAG: phosphonate ABC transporter ATP-binding protein [Bacteroidetes bacterium GWA2_40_15]OFX86863.1 MAG: phosphonate ABC transporter ATP-binding protein [Bacteroidetes bacterium GWC2_40_22]OFY11229.1 MAG: phosphonate ABC transporter ATP-binding protein [Bacteroidetes bacterium GWE2_41_25]OFY57412.1 MAG: phosphonate ABC transporter ATP-binding protein [Bacteroidetes bacterium GWF2_41_9]HAM11190.1 phosphonate ABC transporter ATP-binding protein [Bacteroidales bacterium]